MATTEDVYRVGKVDVHHAFRSGGIEFEHDSCRLDGRGNEWLSEPPPDRPRCGKCFAGLVAAAVPARPRTGRRAVVAGSAGTLALVAALATAHPNGGPVNSPSPSATSVTVGLPSPSVAAPSPTLVPPATPAPTLTPGPTPSSQAVAPAPVPAPIRIVILTPPVVETPRPTPAPTCFHPGQNHGVDECRWPHN